MLGGTLLTFYYLPDTTPKTWKRFAHCEYEADEYCGSITLHPVDGFEGYIRERKVCYSKTTGMQED